MLIAYKYLLQPTKSQEELLNQHFGSVRFVYNFCLAQKNLFWSNHKDNPLVVEFSDKKTGETKTREKKTLSMYEVKAMIPNLKSEFEFLKNVNSLSLQQATIDLENAYKRFFDKKLKAGKPKFKSKKTSNQSFCIPQNVRVDFDCSKVTIPKFLTGIKCVFHRQFTGKVKSATVSKNPKGNYFISILVDDEMLEPVKLPVSQNTTIGIDMGIKDFAICSNSKKFGNPKFLKVSLPRLKRLQKSHSRKLEKAKKVFEYDDQLEPKLTKTGKHKFHLEISSNANKSKIKLAKLHNRVANQRKDYHHQVSAQIANDNQVTLIAIETLKAKNMVKNRKLSKAISDCGWSQFLTFLDYKLKRLGKSIIKIDQWFPSSKTCNGCKVIKTNLTLSDRVFDCQCCGLTVCRDQNASWNIRDEGYRLFAKTVGITGLACGDDVSQVLNLQLSAKQEAIRL
jgi:putative transposase